MKGYVYVLTNEAMPGLVKVGRSKFAAGTRAKQIYKGDTGVPLPFDVHFECLFDDCIEGEALVHESLQDSRVNPKREFFRCPRRVAVTAVMSARAAYEKHRVVMDDQVIEDCDIFLFARQLGVLPVDIAACLQSLKAEDLAPVLERRRAREKLKATTNIVNLENVRGPN